MAKNNLLKGTIINGILQWSHKLNLVLSSISLTVFAWLSWLVINDRLQEFDENFLITIHEILPDSFIYFCKPIYFIGEAEVAVFLVLLSLIILGLKRLWLEAQVVAVSSLTVLILVDQILKPIFFRRRPLGRLLDNIHGRSFPSGHASGNLLLYFLLIYIIGARFPQHRVKLYAIATFILLFMGLSSTYLRVHWLTDIIAGYCLGYILFAICIVLLKIGKKEYRTW